jgi:hypothetical protein
MNNPSLKRRPDLNIAKFEAKKFFERSLLNKDKEYDEPRGLVNYLRHCATDYDELRKAIFTEDERDQAVVGHVVASPVTHV